MTPVNDAICGYHSEQIRDHEQRIRYLERAQWRLTGVVGVISAAAAFIGAFVGK